MLDLFGRCDGALEAHARLPIGERVRLAESASCS